MYNYEKIKKIACFINFFIVCNFLSAQVTKFVKISIANFPEVSTIISVEDGFGVPLGIDPQKIKLYEDGKEVIDMRIIPVDNADLPVFTVIVMDKSGSMKGEAIKKAREGAIEFVNMMGPRDKSAYIFFDTEVTVASSFTDDKESLGKKIQETRVGNDTALIDAILRGAELQDEAPPNAIKVILVLTDGKENKSKSKLDDALAKAKEVGAAIFTIGLGNDIDIRMLKRISSETEGNYYHAPDPKDLVLIYKDISRLLHSQLLITFKSASRMDDNWHLLKIEVPFMGKVITGERGYLLAKESRLPTRLLMQIREKQMNSYETNRVLDDLKRQQEKEEKKARQIIFSLAIVFSILIIVLIMIVIKYKKSK